jgi:hypothetical protein
MTYEVDYSGQKPEQVAHEDGAHPAQIIRYVEVPRRGFTFPSILKTAAVFLTGAAVLFTWETAAPEGYRISTFMGAYDGRIAAAVKAAELEQQSHFDAWAASVKLAADQQSEQYKAVTQGVLANYTASYDQVKIAAQAAYQFQGAYAQTIMGQQTAEQGTDVGIINFMRGFGRVMNGLQPGAGDNAIGYAKDLSGTLDDEITNAARKGTSTPVVDWARGLATPDQVAAKLQSIKPLRLPPPPSLGERRAAIGDPWSSH